MAADYYKTLGIATTASAAEIKKTYRRLAKKYHPDVSKEKNAEDKFKEVQAAYDVLSNAEKRQLYDQFGAQWQQAKQAKERGFDPSAGVNRNSGQRSSGFGGFEGFDNFTSSSGGPFYAAGEGGNAENIFADLFNRQRSSRAYKGQDVRAKIAVDLSEAYTGSTQTIQLSMPGGNKSLRVKIPAGVTDGQQIRLAGQGEPGQQEGENGDLYLEVFLKPHPWFTVMQADIYLTLPISPWEAALGGKISVPTLGGKVELKIAPNSQSGQKLRLQKRGLPTNPPGDQYCILQIITPPVGSDSVDRVFYKKMAEQFASFKPRSKLDA